MYGQTEWAGLIRDVPDFPRPGILFKDITPIVNGRLHLGQMLLCFFDSSGENTILHNR